MKRPGTRGSDPSMPEGVDPERVSASKGSSDIPEHIIEAGSSMLLWLSDEHIEVVPGQPARLRVNVRNISAVVQTFSLHTLGPAAQWTSILPNQISLFPGEEGSASVVVRAQKSPTLPAGHYVIGILARSEVDHTDSVVGEFDVTVRPYHQFKASLSRPTVDIRRRATMFLQIMNDGNSPVTFLIHATDPEGRLVAKLSHASVVLPPGDPTWIKLQIKAPVHLLGSPITHGLIVTTTAARDETTGLDLTDVQPSVQRTTVIQRPLFHFRLGFFGRMALLLLLLGLVATFLVPRLIDAFLPRTVYGSPLVPQSFVAGLDEQQQVLLTWNPSSGATGYSIYAVGNTGNPVPSPSPSSATVTATATATATITVAPSTPVASIPVATDTNPPSVAGIEPTSDATVLRRAALVGQRPASDPATISPTASSSSASGLSSNQAAQLATLPVPLCDDCSHVADVPGGTTRYVIANAPPGITACYRIIAVAGSAQSMFSPQACVTTPGTAGGSASGAPTESGTASGSLPGPTDAPGPDSSGSQTVAPTGSASGKEKFTPTPLPTGSSTPSSPTASATPTTSLPPCPPLSPSATALSSSAVVAIWSVISPTAKDSGCNPKATLTGFQIQQQAGTGWSDITGSPSAQDTAFQITGLGGSIQYCFRMRAVAGAVVSGYTGAFCATTLPGTNSPSAVSPSAVSPSPSGITTSSSPSPTVSATSTKAARALTLQGEPEPQEQAVEPGVPSQGAPGVTAIPGDVVSLRVAVRQAERQARGSRVAADEASLRALALGQQADQQRIVAEGARARVDALANAMYRQGEVSGLLESVLLLGAPRSVGVTNGMSYVTVGGMSAATLLATQEQEEQAAVMAAEIATDAARGAEVLQGLARQQLTSLKGLLRDAVKRRSAAGPQTVIGADGCPVDAPAGTLRGGSQAVGIAELCQRSVAQAATPQAALAIKYALGQLGAPYACRGLGRLEPFRFDCSSFVARAYADGAGVPLTREGWAPSTRNMVPWDGIALDRHYALLAPDKIAAGDLVLYDTGGATYRHVVMALADGFMVHTNACGDVLHIDRFWGTGRSDKGQFLVARRVLWDPSYALAPGDPATSDIPEKEDPIRPADPLAGDTTA